MRKRPLSLLVFVVAATIFTTLSCRKDNPYMSNAEITGWDLRLCVCCGGITVTIDNVPNPNGYAFFLTGDLPAGFSLGDHPQFPIAVKIDWAIDTAHCSGKYIIISRIKRR